MKLCPMPESIESFFEKFERFIIVGHKEPDGDCISCQLALRSFIKRQYNKPVFLLSAGDFKRTEIKMYEELFSATVPPSFQQENTALIITDCTNADRIGEVFGLPKELPTLVVDHHATNNSVGDYLFVNETAPAASLLVQQIIETITGSAPTQEEAEYLFFGLSTDTGFFRHLDESSAVVFEFASRLVRAGANPKKTFAQINGAKSPESRILISRILSRIEYFYDGKLAVSWETLDDTLKYGKEGRDSDTLYQLIQSIRNIEAIVIIRQETETSCTIGFRSQSNVDVANIAAEFGGGGHKNASGAKIDGTIETLKPLIIAAFQKSI